jgi:hypothetical protein
MQNLIWIAAASQSSGLQVLFETLTHTCFIQNMVLHHVDENKRSPPLPFDLLSKVHISLAEGRAMGVGSENIIKYREDFGIPKSDALNATPSRGWDMRELRLEDQRNSRKRSESEVSKSSSTTRDASPTKLQRLHFE